MKDKVENERSNERRQQTKRVMPLIAQLLDAWDDLPNDVAGDDELSKLAGAIRKIDAAMEGEAA